MQIPIRYPARGVRTFHRYRTLLRSFHNWPSFLKLKWTGADAVWLARTRSGLTAEVPPALRFVFKDIFLHQCYGLPAITERLPARPTVLDIGANAGFFALYAFHQRPDVRCLSFEPHPFNFRLLEANCRRNPKVRWQPFEQAVVGEGAGTVTLAVPDDDAFTADAHVLEPGQSAARTITVASRTLEQILRDKQVEHCDWLKMDCEGAEYGILYSTPPEVFRRIRALSLETHGVDQDRRNRDALARHLEALGYTIWLADDAVIHAVQPD